MLRFLVLILIFRCRSANADHKQPVTEPPVEEYPETEECYEEEGIDYYGNGGGGGQMDTPPPANPYPVTQMPITQPPMPATTMAPMPSMNTNEKLLYLHHSPLFSGMIVRLLDLTSPNAPGNCEHEVPEMTEAFFAIDSGVGVYFPERRTFVVSAGPRNAWIQYVDQYYLFPNMTWAIGPRTTHMFFRTHMIQQDSNSWIILAGANSPKLKSYSKKMNIQSFDGSTVLGPDMPAPMRHGCFVKINSTTAIAFSGQIDSAMNLNPFSFYYSFQQRIWSTAPTVQSVRERAACGLVEDTVSSNRYVIMAGGQAPTMTSLNTISTVELLIVGSGSWFFGPSPRNVGFSKSAIATTLDGKTAFLYGGFVASFSKVQGREIFKFQCSNANCQWEKVPQTLPYNVIDAVGAFVHGDTFPCYL